MVVATNVHVAVVRTDVAITVSMSVPAIVTPSVGWHNFAAQRLLRSLLNYYQLTAVLISLQPQLFSQNSAS